MTFAAPGTKKDVYDFKQEKNQLKMSSVILWLDLRVNGTESSKQTYLDECFDGTLGDVQERWTTTQIGPLVHGGGCVDQKDYYGHLRASTDRPASNFTRDESSYPRLVREPSASD